MGAHYAAVVPELDSDADGITELFDNCPSTPNSGQIDTDGDGIGDACDHAVDFDNDGVLNDFDNCILIVNDSQSDIDTDGVGDQCDACPGSPPGADVDSSGCSRVYNVTQNTYFGTIQDAIDAATTLDTIVVAPGTFHENIDFKGKEITLQSSSGPQATIIDGTRLYESVVKCVSDEGPNTVLRGFTVINGCAYKGGGMINEFSSPSVINCTFRWNTADLYGGGMSNYRSAPIVFGCTFAENIAGTYGAGMENYDSESTVSNCYFTRNHSLFFGGGMINWGGSNSQVLNSIFCQNTAERGAGMHNRECSPILTKCVFRGNNAVLYGGAINNLFSSPTLTNCSLSMNSADGAGGVYNWSSHPMLIQCTISGNTASWGGGLLNYAGSSPTIVNSILWNNLPTQVETTSGTPVANYSIVQDGWDGAGGIGILDADPLFVNPDGQGEAFSTADDDMRLSVGSPAIDTGSNGAVPADALDLNTNGDTTEPMPFDLDNGPRFVGGNADTLVVVDMGAYEYQADCNANGVNDGLDIAIGTSTDCDTSGFPDECETLSDCQSNGVSDVCETLTDCQKNGIPDVCEIILGMREDCNGNNVPDECEFWYVHNCCDSNHGAGCNHPAVQACVCGVDPFCCTNTWDSRCVDEVLSLGCGTCPSDSTDCNNNGVMDECDLLLGHDCCSYGHGVGCSNPAIRDCVCDSDPYCCEVEWDRLCVAEVNDFACGDCQADGDCNANGLLDECDLASGTSQDWNFNELPDECDSRGDIDGDGDVDLGDWSIFIDCMSGPNVTHFPGCKYADVDTDNDVDLADSATLQEVWVPELVGDAEAGAMFFAANCAACHGLDGGGGIAPSLRGLSASDLQSGVEGGAIHASLTITAQDYADLAAFLVSECTDDFDCDDALFCNGTETCVNNVCIDNPDPCIPVVEICDDIQDQCIVACQGDQDCPDDGSFCTGVPVCEPGGVCGFSGDPCVGFPICDEDNDLCIE